MPHPVEAEHPHGAFAHVLPNAAIGEDGNIRDHCFAEGVVSVSNNVTVKRGI